MTAVALDGRVGVGDSSFDAQLHAEPGEHLAIVGPNGAGKSTLLRSIAGHLPLRSGRLEIDGVVVDEPEAGRFVAPEVRGVVYQPQGGALFPHLTVRDNVAFGMRSRGHTRSASRRAASSVLGRLELSDLAERRPATLSGGQAARVALARSVAAGAPVVLLDEPSAAFDALTRSWFRSTLDDLEMTVVLVTHDPAETILTADRVAVVLDGQVVQTGTPAEVAGSPATGWIAHFMGVNLVGGTARGHTVELAGGASVTIAEDHHGPVHVSFPANAVTLHRDRPAGSARNVWPVTVTSLTAEPDDSNADIVRVAFTGPVTAAALVTPGAVRDLGLHPGSECWVSVKATELTVIPG